MPGNRSVFKPLRRTGVLPLIPLSDGAGARSPPWVKG